MRLGQKVFPGGGDISFLFSTAIKNAVNGTSMLSDWNSKTLLQQDARKIRGEERNPTASKLTLVLSSQKTFAT